MTAPVLVKLGGALLDQPRTLDTVCAQLVHAHHHDAPRILVHGGGAAVDRLLTATGRTSTRRDGLRVTPDDEIDLVVGVLAGTMNARLCGAVRRAGGRAVGVTTADGGSLIAARAAPELGRVGHVTPGDPSFLTMLLASGSVPVVSSIGLDSNGEALNVNADEAASALAELLGACEIELLTDVPGVLDAGGTLLPELSPTSIQPLIADGTIHGGMLPKVRSAVSAAERARCAVRIRSWGQLDTSGTRITANHEAVA